MATPKPEPKFHVGQEVLIHHWNVDRSGPPNTERTTIAKVGRTIVYISRFGRLVGYRMDSGAINDDYAHSTLYTLEEWETRAQRLDLVNRIQGAYRVTLPTKLSIDGLERILAVLDEELGS